MKHKHSIRRNLLVLGVALLVVGGAISYAGNALGWSVSRPLQWAPSKASRLQTKQAEAQRSYAARMNHQSAQKAATASGTTPPPRTTNTSTTADKLTIPTINAGDLALSPSGGTIVAGSTVAINLVINSGSELVNATQVLLHYDANDLSFTSFEPSSSFDIVAASDTSTAGIIRVARAASVAVSGTQTVVTINFQVKTGATGSTRLTLDSAGSSIVRTSDASNILQSVISADFQIK